MAVMANALPVPVWQQDSQGFIYTQTGVKAARVDADGVVWLWDKRAKAEVPLTAEIIYVLAQGVRSPGAESHASVETDN